ncbi:MAG: transposase, partial [Oligoflexia bacterium]|nr:transposase [Oligoflexia bacterium]
MHITLRSSMAKGGRSFLSKDKVARIRDIINRHAKLFDIRLYDFSINSNHIHLLLKLQYRDAYSKFIRSVSGRIARIALDAEKGSAKLTEQIKKFWDTRPFSRIVSWGRDYLNTFYYLFENSLEAGGFIKYRDRKNKGSPATI